MQRRDLEWVDDISVKVNFITIQKAYFGALRKLKVWYVRLWEATCYLFKNLKEMREKENITTFFIFHLMLILIQKRCDIYKNCMPPNTYKIFWKQ